MAASGDCKQQPGLTPKQQQVLRLVADGLSAKEIAQRTNLSPKTIEFHKASLYDRLGIRSAAALVRYAFRTGIIVESHATPPRKVFRVAFCHKSLGGSSGLAHVRAIDKIEAIRKLQARLSNARELEVRSITEVEGLFILD